MCVFSVHSFLPVGVIIYKQSTTFKDVILIGSEVRVFKMRSERQVSREK